MSEASDLILLLSFFMTWTARYKNLGNCEGKGSMAAAACPFQYPAKEKLSVNYSVPKPFVLNIQQFHIFRLHISVALQKQKTFDNCVRDLLSNIASLSKRYFRYSNSFTDIKQSPTSRISPRAHYHWRQHLLKVLQTYVSMLLTVTKSQLQQCLLCPKL